MRRLILSFGLMALAILGTVSSVAAPHVLRGGAGGALD